MSAPPDRSKRTHFRALQQRTKIDYKDCLFFDDDSWNIKVPTSYILGMPSPFECVHHLCSLRTASSPMTPGTSRCPQSFAFTVLTCICAVCGPSTLVHLPFSHLLPLLTPTPHPHIPTPPNHTHTSTPTRCPQEVSQLGVTCVYTPNGLTKAAWEQGLKLFAQQATKRRERAAKT